jgi:hypothetical protein
MMINDECIEKDINNGAVAWFKLLSQYLLGWGEEIHETYVRMAGLRAEMLQWEIGFLPVGRKC